MSATGTARKGSRKNWLTPGGAMGSSGESRYPTRAPSALRCSDRLSVGGGAVPSSTSPYCSTLWLGERQQNHSLSVVGRGVEGSEGVVRDIWTPTHPPHLPLLCQSETLAPPIADLAKKCPLTEAEQTLLANQAHELRLQLLPQLPGVEWVPLTRMIWVWPMGAAEEVGL